MKNFARISISLITLAGLAGVAAAGDGGAAAKAPTPAPDAKKAPTPTPTPTPTPDKAPPAAAMPKAPADIAAAFKAMSGNWKCTGTALGNDMKTEVPTKGTYKAKTDLDGWWIITNFTETKKGGFKMTQYATFDAKASKWSASMFDNMGSHETTESAGMKDNKMVWEGSSIGMMGTMKSRHTEEMKGPKETHMFGEYSMDGKAWMKAYDMTCKK